MISKKIQEKGVLAKLLEKGIKILIRKECKNIGEINIDIFATSIQIVKGVIQKIHIIAQEINYKDLLFDEIKLEANDVKIVFNRRNKELNLRNNLIIKFKISLSEISLKTVLLHSKWNWVGNMISNEIFNQNKLEDITIKNGQILIKTSKNNIAINTGEKLDIKAEKGKLYLENKAYNKSFRIPIEDKIFIKDVYIQNNLITITANSPISF
tara:strand:+ start:62 stop:694 length:633 start_codon:yes stop_codon:yes gene_type:complete